MAENSLRICEVSHYLHGLALVRTIIDGHEESVYLVRVHALSEDTILAISSSPYRKRRWNNEIKEYIVWIARIRSYLILSSLVQS